MKGVTLVLLMLILCFSVLCGCNGDGVNLYFPETETFWLVPENRVLDSEEPLAVLNALLAGPSQQGLTSLIPDGVRVKSLQVQQGVCYVDFSSEFNRVYYGSGPEAAMLGMIVNTLTELEGIEAVYITVEGEVPKCFHHIGSSGPFTWNDSLLKRLRLP